MDLLMTCARTFDKLAGYEYHFILGRKGKLKEINLKFSDTDFHHLAGLHKLRDINIARANRSNVFRQILNGRITYATLAKSQFLPEIQSRLNALPNLEALLDGHQLIFRYNRNVSPYSAIESEFLLKMGENTVLNIAFLFLDQSELDVYFCRSFFQWKRQTIRKGRCAIRF